MNHDTPFLETQQPETTEASMIPTSDASSLTLPTFPPQYNNHEQVVLNLRREWRGQKVSVTQVRLFPFSSSSHGGHCVATSASTLCLFLAVFFALPMTW